jgi:hypothetical protein
MRQSKSRGMTRCWTAHGDISGERKLISTNPVSDYDSEMRSDDLRGESGVPKTLQTLNLKYNHHLGASKHHNPSMQLLKR